LIPSPNVTDNHQEKNARALEKEGAAEVILEKDCTPQYLMTRVTALLEDSDRSKAMGSALRKMCVLDSAERLCDIIRELASK
jgi:UDP-N-acetylglucosamine--N-acetylmuramyl-(pentapeptide) pyrophosphoryl-undecaprenol N-acetylglucosamine transferase